MKANEEIRKQPSAHGVSWRGMVALVALPNYDDNGRHRFSLVMAMEERLYEGGC